MVEGSKEEVPVKRQDAAVSSEGTGFRRQKLKYRKFHLNIWKYFCLFVFKYEDGQTLKQVAQRRSRVYIHGETQKLTGWTDLNNLCSDSTFREQLVLADFQECLPTSTTM